MNAMNRHEHFNAFVSTGTPDSPMSEALGIRLESFAPGEVWARIEAKGGKLNNPLGVLHGGVAASLVDHVMGLAMLSMLSEDEVFTTIELKVNYLRAVKEDGPIRARGKALKVGKTIGVIEGDIYDAAGELLAHAICSCIRLPARFAGPSRAIEASG
jgi:uncharacterized protein (TIGR00369 family)